MKKVSFDFDDTLSLPIIQDYAKSLINKGIEVHIVTTRYRDINQYPKDFLKSWESEHDKKATNNDLFIIASKLRISKKHIHFTNMRFKWEFFKSNSDFIWHLDDNYTEKIMMNTRCKVHCVLHKNGDYFEDTCNNLLKDN